MRATGNPSRCQSGDRGSRRPREAGFTFAEVLATMMFVAIVIPVCLHGIALAGKAETIATRKLNAVMLAEKTLNELVVTQQWQSGINQGEYGAEWPGYRWTANQTVWTDSSMRLLTVTVFFEVQGRVYDVHVSTLIQESSI